MSNYTTDDSIERYRHSETDYDDDMPDSVIKQVEHLKNLILYGKYSKALNIYLQLLRAYPSLLHQQRQSLELLLKYYHCSLAAQNKPEKIFHNYMTLLDMFPSDKILINGLGWWLYKYDQMFEACHYFQQALDIDNTFVSAETNLNLAKSAMVDRWHYRMLNDYVRNSAYHRALQELITTQDTVFDIGAGSGLLSFYAFEHKPKSITACESSKYMVALAEKVFEVNETTDIKLINKLSSDIKKEELKEPKSLIVTEIFDAGLFGESCLETLIHTLENFAVSNATVIPAKAEVFVVGVYSESLAARYRLSTRVCRFLNVPDLNVQSNALEPYDCDDIAFYKDIKYVTSVEKVLTVKFNCIQDMKRKLGEDVMYEVNLTASEDGIVNLLISWFNLYLTEDIIITTDPRDPLKATAWQQAILYDFIPKSVKKEQKLCMKLSSKEGKLQVIDEVTPNTYLVSADLIRFLNDEDYMNLICDCIQPAIKYLSHLTELDHCHIVDICPFPIFGFLILKQGIGELSSQVKDTDKYFVEAIFEANNISQSKVELSSFAEEKNIHAFFSYPIQSYGLLNTEILCFGNNLKNKMVDGCLIVPNEIRVVVQLVSCNWLETIHNVIDVNMGNCKVAELINRFQTSQFIDLNISNLEYNSFTDEADIATIVKADFDTVSSTVEAVVKNNGVANAILCWYKVQLIKDGKWISTNQTFSFTNGVAFMLNPKRKVENQGIIRFGFFGEEYNFSIKII